MNDVYTFIVFPIDNARIFVARLELQDGYHMYKDVFLVHDARIDLLSHI